MINRKQVKQLNNINFQNIRKTKKTEKDKLDNKTKIDGKTEIVSADVEEIKNLINSDSDTKDYIQDTPITFKAPSPQKYPDNEIWNHSTESKDFIIETLKEQGIEPDEDTVNQLFIVLVKAMLGENFYEGEAIPDGGSLNIATTIKSVTGLINISLALDENESEGVIRVVTGLISFLLNNNGTESSATYGEVKSFIMAEFENLNSNVSVEPIVEPDIPEPEVIDTPEKAMNALLNKIDNTEVDGNMSINDFLLQFETQAAQYIQLQFGYAQDFSRIIAKFLATAVSETTESASGLMKDVELAAIKAKFIDFIQDMSFLDTTNGVYAREKNSNGVWDVYSDGKINYIFAWNEENGYRVGDTMTGSEHHHSDSNLVYNEDGTPNNGVFMSFLVNYLKNDIYFGTLNSQQMKEVMTEVIKEFAKGNLSTHYGSNVTAVAISSKSNTLDKNSNGTLFDDMLNAMLKVAAEIIRPVDTNNIDSFALDEFFGNSNSLTASQIRQNENTYLQSENSGIRGTIQALVDAANQYNINNNIDYIDFVNAYIKIIYEKCGEEVVTDNKGNALLTKEILQKFINKYSAQALKDLAGSKDVSDAYYMEWFYETGGINGVIDGAINQGVTGDCWLHASLISLKSSETGQEIIRNAIHSFIGEDGKTYYTVTFKGGCGIGHYFVMNEQGYNQSYFHGIGTTYTFSLDDILSAMRTGYYAIKDSDPDDILMELAVSKLREENNLWLTGQNNVSGDKYLWGSYNLGELLYYLTGKTIGYPGSHGDNNMTITYPGTNSNEYYIDQTTGRRMTHSVTHTAEEFKQLILEKIANGTIESGTIGNDGMYILKLSTSSSNSHAYGVTRFTEEGIYYVNPYVNGEELFMSWEEYCNPDQNVKISYTPFDSDLIVPEEA